VNTWQTYFSLAGVTAKDTGILADRIDGDELLTQRTQFDSNRFNAVTTKKQRNSPFR